MYKQHANEPALSAKKAPSSNQKPSLFSDGEDELFSSQPVEKPKPKPEEKKKEQAPTSKPPSKQKPSLFSDEESDLFGGGTSTEEPTVVEKKEEVAEEQNKKPWKPVGGVSLFGGVDLFAGKKPSFTEDEESEKESEPKQDVKKGTVLGQTPCTKSLGVKITLKKGFREKRF